MKPKKYTMNSKKFYENYFLSLLALSVFYLKFSNAIDVAPVAAVVPHTGNSISNHSLTEKQAVAVQRSEESAQQIQANAERIINTFKNLNMSSLFKMDKKKKNDDTLISADAIDATKEPSQSQNSNELNQDPKLYRFPITNPSTEAATAPTLSKSEALQNENLIQTTTLTDKTNFRIFENGGYCENKSDGLYDDPDDCENFIICYSSRTFRTKCALGTMWNHIKKQCDFPDQVDCERRPIRHSTPSTPATENATKITPPMYTRRTVQSRHPIVVEDFNARNSGLKPRSNIVMASVLVPLAIIVLVVLIASLYVWHRSFKEQKRRMVQSNRNLMASNASVARAPKPKPNRNHNKNNSNSNQTDDDEEKPQECPWSIRNPIPWNRSRSSFRPNNIIHFCSKKGSCMRSVKSNSDKGSRSIPFEDLSKVPAANAIPLKSMQPETVQIMNSNSHGTLSSHFEENNWDYNFATRGLYLSQPWVKGHYNHAATGDSFNGSVVLTLDPCVDPNENMVSDREQTRSALGSHNQEANTHSDTDGYYA